MTDRMPQGKKTVSQDDILQVFDGCDDPIMSAKEVADELDVTRQCAHDHLMQLYEEGLIERKKSGARTVIWWVS